MSVEQVRAALECAADIPAAARHVLLVLATYADADGKRVFPSVANLSRQTGLDRRTVQRMFRVLESAALMVVQERSVGSLPTSYRLTLPPGIPPQRHTAAGRHIAGGGAAIATQGGGILPKRGGVLPPNPSVISHEPQNAGARARGEEPRAPAGTLNGAEPHRPPLTPELKATMKAAALGRPSDPKIGNGTPTPLVKHPMTETEVLLETERRRRQAAAIADSLATAKPVPSRTE